MTNDAEAILETDERAVVEAEQIRRRLGEAHARQIEIEPMRQMEIAPMDRQRHRCGQIDDDEIRLYGPEARVILLGGWLTGLSRRWLNRLLGRLLSTGRNNADGEPENKTEENERPNRMRVSDHGGLLEQGWDQGKRIENTAPITTAGITRSVNPYEGRRRTGERPSYATRPPTIVIDTRIC